MKLPTLPFVAAVEWVAGTKQYAWQHAALYATILAGVWLTIAGEVRASWTGTAVAMASFMSAGTHQFFCGRLQAAYSMTPSRLLAFISPIKAIVLFASGPFLDKALFGAWLGAYAWTGAAASLVAGTCLLAVVLNLAQYTVISLLGAGPYQAFSQLKTAAVVVLGSLVFQGDVRAQQLAGTALAIAGVLSLARFERHLERLKETAFMELPSSTEAQPPPPAK
ncbi:URGT2 [Scenedesmus sp. PABB004]|nr:URGT2 [Scenedesmus sp. PABB004]